MSPSCKFPLQTEKMHPTIQFFRFSQSYFFPYSMHRRRARQGRRKGLSFIPFTCQRGQFRMKKISCLDFQRGGNGGKGGGKRGKLHHVILPPPPFPSHCLFRDPIFSPSPFLPHSSFLIAPHFWLRDREKNSSRDKRGKREIPILEEELFLSQSKPPSMKIVKTCPMSIYPREI